MSEKVAEISKENECPVGNAEGTLKRAAAVQAAIDALEELSIGVVEKFDSYDALEAGCLSCSGVAAIEEK